MSVSYIYVRSNNWYKIENVVKQGVSECFIERENTFTRSEIIKGEYILIIQVPLNKLKLIDKLLKNYLTPYNIYKGGGTEFYTINIIKMIPEFLEKTNIEYRILTNDEIMAIERKQRLQLIKNKERIKQIINEIDKQKFIMKLKYNKKYKQYPNEQQYNILLKIKSFYLENNIGKLIWACGMGKTMMALFIIERLQYKSIVIGVPSINLQNQFKNSILKIFKNKENILYVGGGEHDDKSIKTIIVYFEYL